MATCSCALPAGINTAMTAIEWVTDFVTNPDILDIMRSLCILSLTITTWELKYRLSRLSKRITELYELIGATTGGKDKSLNEEKMKSDIQILETIAEAMHAINSALLSLPDGESKDKVEALRAHLAKLAVRIAYHERRHLRMQLRARRSYSEADQRWLQLVVASGKLSWCLLCSWRAHSN